MSAHDVGIGRGLSWVEACDLLDAALRDSTTEIFVAVNDWDYPASTVDLMTLVAHFGDGAKKLLPYREAGSPRVSAEEEAAAHAELLDEIRFS